MAWPIVTPTLILIQLLSHGGQYYRLPQSSQENLGVIMIHCSALYAYFMQLVFLF